jgi:hypothetical protein
MSPSDSIFGKVWITPELFEMGRIKFNSDNVIVELVSGKILTSNNSDIFFETINKITLNEIGKSVSEEIDSPINIQVKPVLMIRHSYVNQ